MNMLRLLGYILLVLGLLSVEWKQFDARRIIYTTTIDQLQQMSQQQSFTQDDVRLAMVNSASTVWDRTAPWFIMPALIMFIGGVLLDIGWRRRVRGKQPNPH
jgi:hypothetical protein